MKVLSKDIVIMKYKLARDIQIEFDNLDADYIADTDYYQDVLKIRAAVQISEN